jgi:hypothetical protein
MNVTMKQLPGSSIAWIFGSAAPLDTAVAERILAAIGEFIDEWNAHGAAIAAAAEIRDGRFLVVSADEVARTCGGSMDELYRAVSEIGRDTGVKLGDSNLVFYRDAAGEIHAATRNEFRELASSGAIGPDTQVFDTTAERLDMIRAGEWQKAASRSWHAALLPKSVA